MAGRGRAQIAVVGCGAVAEHYYVPALLHLVAQGNVDVRCVFDPDTGRRDLVARMLGAVPTASTYDETLATRPDLVIIASPPHVHFDQVMGAIAAGVSCLCEKPFTMTATEANMIVAESSRGSVDVWVAHVRRQLAATRAIRRFVRSNILGEIQEVRCFEGGPFTWPVSSPQYFLSGNGAAGALLDLGAHTIDLITWWFGAPQAISCEDDSMGGPEANCRLALKYETFDAHMRLSRDWAQPNVYRIIGTESELVWETNNAGEFWVKSHGSRVADKLRVELLKDEPPYWTHFAQQILQVIAPSIESQVPKAVDVIATVRLLETAKEHSTFMAMPWLSSNERAAIDSRRGRR